MRLLSILFIACWCWATLAPAQSMMGPTAFAPVEKKGVAGGGGTVTNAWDTNSPFCKLALLCTESNNPTIKDWSAQGLNMSLVAPPSYFSWLAPLNGTNGHFYADGGDYGFTAQGYNLALGPKTGATFSAWVKVVDGTTTRPICSRNEGANNEWLFYITTTKKAGLAIYSTDLTAYIGVVTSNVLPTNVWCHLAVTWDGNPTNTGMAVYTNGVEALPHRIAGGSFVKPSYLNQYTYYATAYNSVYFVGGFGNIRIYGTNLNASAVNGLFSDTQAGYPR